MGRVKGLIEFSGNFEPKMAEPFDGRVRVELLSDLTNPTTWTNADGNVYLYKEIIVSVYNDNDEENNGAYRLVNDDYTDVENWVKIGSDVAEPAIIKIERESTDEYLDDVVVGYGLNIDRSNRTPIGRGSLDLGSGSGGVSSINSILIGENSIDFGEYTDGYVGAYTARNNLTIGDGNWLYNSYYVTIEGDNNQSHGGYSPTTETAEISSYGYIKGSRNRFNKCNHFSIIGHDNSLAYCDRINIIGNMNNIYVNSGIVVGWSNNIEGGYVNITGSQITSEGYRVLISGTNINNSGGFVLISGEDIENIYNNKFIFGKYNENKENVIIEIGNGDYSERKNALELYNNGKLSLPQVKIENITENTDVITKEYLENYVDNTSDNTIVTIDNTYQITNDDDFVAISNTTTTVNLPTLPTEFKDIKIVDARGDASVNNITISGNGKNINNDTSVIINTDFGYVSMRFIDNKWIIYNIG